MIKIFIVVSPLVKQSLTYQRTVFHWCSSQRQIAMTSSLCLELARFLQRVTAIARTGLAFSQDGFDRERYEELLREAASLHAVLAGAPAGAADELLRDWREQVGAGYDGYVTTAVGCGAIVFNLNDEVLMIKRANGRWFYPGGFCDVGFSPAENAVREVREETGLLVKPIRLMALTDSLKLGSPGRHVYSMLFYCQVQSGEIRPHPLEVIEAGFYPLDRIPEPLHSPNRHWLTLAREFHFERRVEPYFDPL
jgi:ADP-ribose pyrophosphatase YjhB (NUDIX family)